MRSGLWFTSGLLLAVLTGCGGGADLSSGGAKSAPPGYGGASDYATSTTAAEPAAPPATSAPYGGESGGARAEATAPAPEQRPGLGTEWGESRESHVRDVTFFRGDPDRPFAVASLFYNDRAGVDALAAYHGDRAPYFHEYAARGGAITISIRDAGGEPLDALHVGDRTYVIGSAGERYSIVLTNHTRHRFEAVGTVDGLDVINGRPGNLSNRGYVLMPYATLEIDGFRQSSDAVAAFRFGRVSDSYAAQTGSARNVGVIGVAFFDERGDAYDDDELRTRDTANPFPGSDPRYARPPR